MPQFFARHLLASTLVLGSFGTLADAALAEDKPTTIHYECTVPATGSVRCGNDNRNIRIGAAKRLNIQLDQIPQNADPKKKCA